MTECSDNGYYAPQEAVTARNLELAIKNLSGMKTSLEAIYEASTRPENQDFADELLTRALRIFQIGEEMNASCPV